jgi:predicted Fe-Mo cluster-binding NifX family protein
MSVTKVAIATINDKGLHDQVSETFARAKTFTLVNIEDNTVKAVKVVKNPAA